MDETGRSLIPKRFRIEFLGRRCELGRQGPPKYLLSSLSIPCDRLEEPGMKRRRALGVAVTAAVLLALSLVRFSPDDAIPITGLLVACGVLLAFSTTPSTRLSK
jgi:hypothetical protein